jgi:hypothetical protein
MTDDIQKKTSQIQAFLPRMKRCLHHLVNAVPKHEERVYCDVYEAKLVRDTTFYKARSDDELIGKWLTENEEWAFDYIHKSIFKWLEYDGSFNGERVIKYYDDYDTAAEFVFSHIRLRMRMITPI